MKNYGVFLGAFVTANTGTHTLTSAATIHSTLLGQVPPRSPGACLVRDGFDEFVNTTWCRRVPSPELRRMGRRIRTFDPDAPATVFFAGASDIRPGCRMK